MRKNYQIEFRQIAILVTRLGALVLFILAGCSEINPPSPTPLPTVILDESGSALPPSDGRISPGLNSVTASGSIVPFQEAKLVFPLNGRIKVLDITVGDAVQVGQVLAQMEGEEDLQAAVSNAEYELLQAEQALEDLKKDAGSARIEAMNEIIKYERAVRDAQYVLDNFTIPANQVDMDTVEALQDMKERLDVARNAFKPFKYRPSNDKSREDYKKKLDEAQADYNAAVKRLQYEYDLEVAEAKLEDAQGNYLIFQSGPDPEKVKLAEKRIETAKNQIAAAKAALERLRLTSPFSGIVSQVANHAGEWVIAGQTVLTVADLAHLRVETTDLSERDIPNVRVGQGTTVYIKALGVSEKGRVVEIAPLADTLGGDVVYRTTIELENIPAGLRAGMSVEVTFEQGD